MEEKKLTLADTVTTLIENKKYSSVRDILLTMQAVDIAAMFEEVPEQKIPLLFRILPKDLALLTSFTLTIRLISLKKCPPA